MKQLATLPILESMIYINLAVKWAMACGVKDKKIYRYLKKYYYQHKITNDTTGITISNGWYLFNPFHFVKIFRGVTYFYRDNRTTVIKITRHYIISYGSYPSGEFCNKEIQFAVKWRSSVYSALGQYINNDPTGKIVHFQ